MGLWPGMSYVMISVVTYFGVFHPSQRVVKYSGRGQMRKLIQEVLALVTVKL